MESGRVTDPAVGMAVKLRGYAPHGKIIRADAGLWVVRVDEPIDGMSELTVAETALIGLRQEPFTDQMVETLTASVNGDAIAIEHVDLAKIESPAMMKMREFAADMCKCTDNACAKRVADEMTEWSKTMTKPATKLSESEQKEATALGTQLSECMTRALAAD